jgi:hypothetical protein
MQNKIELTAAPCEINGRPGVCLKWNGRRIKGVKLQKGEAQATLRVEHMTQPNSTSGGAKGMNQAQADAYRAAKATVEAVLVTQEAADLAAILSPEWGIVPIP